MAVGPAMARHLKAFVLRPITVVAIDSRQRSTYSYGSSADCPGADDADDRSIRFQIQTVLSAVNG